jgi:hypothetical protein
VDRDVALSNVKEREAGAVHGGLRVGGRTPAGPGVEEIVKQIINEDVEENAGEWPVPWPRHTWMVLRLYSTIMKL